MTELNLQRKRAPGRGLVQLPELRLRRPKEPQVALVAAGSGTETQVEPGWMLAAVLTTNLRRAEPEQVAREHLGLVNLLAQAMTAAKVPELLAGRRPPEP